MDNLAWAYFECNTGKSGDIASIDFETGGLTPLYNPRTQHWDDHFEMKGPAFVGKTAIGRITIRLLEINHPDQVELRKLIMDVGLW